MTTRGSTTDGLTPFMVQFNRVKAEHPDKLIFFRMGDFYELFGDDAREASSILGITLTSRAQGKNSGRIPLAGVPHHSAEKYLTKLLSAGKKVVLVEQTEDPKHARGIVKREVVEVLTPGTPTLDSDPLCRPIICIVAGPERAGAARLEFATGRFEVTEDDLSSVLKWVKVSNPAEILVSEIAEDILEQFSAVHLTQRSDEYFRLADAEEVLSRHFGTQTLTGFGVGGLDLAISAAGALLAYVQETKKSRLDHLTHVRRVDLADRMFLDSDTVSHLELLEPRDRQFPHTSLYYQVNRTCTTMGARLLRRTLRAPYKQKADINPRLGAAAFFAEDSLCAGEVREILGEIPDLERIAGRIGFGKAGPRDLVGLASGIEKLPGLERHVRRAGDPYLDQVCEELPDLSEPAALIRKTLRDDPPVLATAGGLVRDGVSKELTDLRSSIADSKKFLATLQSEERVKTGIPTLKVGYNKVFGYYIEVTHLHRDKIPHHYIRKQTLVSAERYITDELKVHEDRVLSAEERISDLELRIFEDLRDSMRDHTRELQATAEGVAAIDLACAWGELARERRYVRPEIDDAAMLEIEGGRHPVVEQVVAAGRFVPNDTSFQPGKDQIQVITGPNMSGKSTYLRQVGLIVLLAQCGSFVPASRARIGLTDRIFTRVGASDQLALGRSTFLVEMEEAANILHYCTDRSLVLLDEMGRGTSTYDGLSIAWAVTEYLHETPDKRARTMFATHYHELTVLADLYPRIHNYQVAVKKHGERVIFLHHIKPGGCDDSYGIAVARLAGLPPDVIARAQEILSDLERGDFNPETLKARNKPQMGLFTPPADAILSDLSELQVDSLAPLEALNRLAEFVARAKLRINQS